VVTLDYVLHEMRADAYAAWWAYFVEWDKLAKQRKDQAEHDAVMDAAMKATRR
jgi:hypothetical protein